MSKQNKIVYLADHQVDKAQLLDQVFRDHGEAMRRFLQVRLALEADREDIIQDLFVRLSRVDNLAQRISDESGSTRHYLFSILSSLIIDRQRYTTRHNVGLHDSLEAESVATEQHSPEVEVTSQQQADRAVELLQRMDSKYREAFVLNRFRYKSYREISMIMGVSVSTVERYIASALTKLRKGLKS